MSPQPAAAQGRPPSPMGLDHRVVLASAGTGKTFAIASRYIALLAAGEDPGAILATTFTRKAAGEITLRVLKRLSSAAASDVHAAAESGFVGAELTPARCAALLRAVVAALHRLNIQTIDSLLGRMASGFAHELGLPPGWRIADAAADAQLRSEALARAWESLDRDDAFALVEQFQAGRNSSRVHQALLDILDELESAFHQTGGRPAPWQAVDPCGKPASDSDLASLRLALQQCARFIPQNAAGGPNHVWRRALENIDAHVAAADWPAFAREKLVADAVAGGEKFAGKEIPPDLRAALLPLHDHALATMCQSLRARNVAVHRIAERFDACYTALKRERAIYRFDDIPRLLATLRQDGGLEQIYYRLDSRLRHLLLDEFQDTSIQQFRILRPMLEELLSGEGAPGPADRPGVARTVFCVGDAKQSLYSWRGAESDLLAQLPRHWPQFRIDALSKSFRSSPVVLDAINTVFQGLAANAALAGHAEVAAAWSGRFDVHQAAKPLPGEVRLLVGPEDAAGDDGAPPLARFVADRAAGILAAAPWAKVAVLVRRNSVLPGLMRALAGNQLPVSKEGGNPLTDSPIVAATLSLLQFAEHPGDSAAHFHVASSPLGPVLGLRCPDPDGAAGLAVSRSVRDALCRDGFASFLADLHARLAGAIPRSDFARFGQLVDLAEQFDASPAAGPTDFVRLVAATGVAQLGDDGPGTVRVMTIHAAKGLEFDAVILTDLDRGWLAGPARGIIVRRPGPFADADLATVAPPAPLRAAHPALKELHRIQTDRNIGEELCGLYVGMSRAVHCLEAIIEPGSDTLPLCSASILRDALAPGASRLPGTELWSAGNRAWAAHAPPDKDPPIQGSELPIAVHRPRHTPPTRLATVTPSTLESGGAVSAGDIFSPGAATARRRGSVHHRWYSRIGWLDDPLPSDDDLLADARELGLTPDDAYAELATFHTFTRHPAIAGADGVLRRSRYRARPAARVHVLREWSFCVPHKLDGGPVLLTGQIDRLVVGLDLANQVLWAELIDFKTDQRGPNFSAWGPGRVAVYAPQIEAYRSGAATILACPPALVETCLVFTTVGVTVCSPR